MEPAVAQLHLLEALADELARSGVRHAVVSPGSRNAPLLLALGRRSGLTTHPWIDERAAAFAAVGIARASREPVVLACTSGTAAANYAPAVHEAHEAGLPLIVLTADRPPELRDVGAGQVIDQVKLFGTATRWSVDLGTGHEPTVARLRWVRTLACRLVHAATAPGGRGPGPVHLDVPLREPLIPAGEHPPAALAGRPGGRPWLSFGPVALHPAQRPIVVAGRGSGGRARPLATALGAPLLPDPLSGERGGEHAVAHFDALLRHEPFADGHRPDVVVRIGDLPTSKPLRGWLASADEALQVAVPATGAWTDPDGVLDAVATDLAPPDRPADPAWLDAWRTADDIAAAALDATLEGEAAVARELLARWPADGAIVVASSMPIRDVECFAPRREPAPTVLSNRGANGIDGTIASAIGVAAATRGPVALLIGDVALAHDAGSLLHLARAPALLERLTIVLLDNAGGGIFSFLPVASQADLFEPLVATPPALDVPALAAAAGLLLREDRLGDLPAPGTLIHLRSDRARNVEQHHAANAAVAAALRQRTKNHQ